MTYSLGNCCSIQLSYESVVHGRGRPKVATGLRAGKVACLALLVGCADPPGELPARADSAAPTTVPWSGDLPRLEDAAGATRGMVPLRTIVHLHSPLSHDACDSAGYVDGALDEACLDDLRAALCRTAVDVAWVTDHPDHAATLPWESRLPSRPGDTLLTGEDGGAIGFTVACDEPERAPIWLPGSEDALMPVGLRRTVHPDLTTEHWLLNERSPEAIAAFRDAGSVVFVNHTEGYERDELLALQDAGVAGVEVFNLHAAFDPRIRGADLGLDPAGWLQDVSPFTLGEGTAEPDLFVLGVLDRQEPSIAHWDAMSARGRTVGVVGTDAHQNVMPIPLRDGERGDSFRRMLRWMSNVVLAEARTPEAAQAALAAGRSYVLFDILGTPTGLDVHLEAADGTIHELGADAPTGELVVGCPSLAAQSPRGEAAPEITVQVLRDGEPWASGCGRHRIDTSGSYRVEVTMIPHHLAPFLGEAPDVWMKPYQWVYTNPIRVTDVR